MADASTPNPGGERRTTGQPDPRLESPGVSRNAGAAVVTPAGATPDEQVADLARRTVDRLLAPIIGARTDDPALRPGTGRGGFDPQGILDIVHGQRRQNDPNFDARFIDAVRSDPRMRQHRDLLDAVYGFQFSQLSGSTEQARRELTSRLFSSGDAVLFNAYLNNPGGTSRPEDIAQIAIEGTGNDVGMIRNVYADLRARYPNDEAGYRQAVAELDRAFANRYGGGESLDRRLTGGSWPELGSGDQRSYRAARIGPMGEEALRLYNSVEAATLFPDGEAALRTLTANLGNLDALGAAYREVAGRQPGRGRVDTQGVDRIRAGLRNRLNDNERVRADILFDRSRTPQQRANAYLEETLRQYGRGQVGADVLLSSMRTLTTAPEGQQPLTTAAHVGAAMRPALLAAQERARRDAPRTGQTPVGAMVDSLLGTQPNVADPSVTVATVRERLLAARGDRDKLLEVARGFDLLNDADRAAVRAAFPPGQWRQYLSTGGRAYAGDNGLTQRLNDALDGRNNDAASLLRGAALHPDRRTARPQDVIDAVRALRGNAGGFPAAYGPSFESDLGRLDADTQRQIRALVAVPAAIRGLDAQQRETVVRDMIRHVRTANDAEQSGLGGFMTQLFGRTTPVLNDTTRDLVRNAEGLRGFNQNAPIEQQRAQLVELFRAHQRFSRALESTAGERREIAENAALVTTAVVGVATGAGALTVARVVLAANAVGVTSVATKAAMLGDRYTPEEAMYDFLTNAAFESVGMVGFHAAGAGLRRLTSQ